MFAHEFPVVDACVPDAGRGFAETGCASAESAVSDELLTRAGFSRERPDGRQAHVRTRVRVGDVRIAIGQSLRAVSTAKRLVLAVPAFVNRLLERVDVFSAREAELHALVSDYMQCAIANCVVALFELGDGVDGHDRA